MSAAEDLVAIMTQESSGVTAVLQREPNKVDSRPGRDR
jgi:hypothetical protein